LWPLLPAPSWDSVDSSGGESGAESGTGREVVELSARAGWNIVRW
jgi:hypothetical protein